MNTTEIAEKIVKEEIYANASWMMQNLSEVAERVEGYDEYLNLMQGKPDYEEAAAYFIRNNADADELREIIEYFGHDVEDEDFSEGRKFREEVVGMVSEPDWVCQEFDLDVDYSEIYQHWIVSDWLGEKLKAQGEVVEEYMGFTIWGRATYGQAIDMEWVIQQIAAGV